MIEYESSKKAKARYFQKFKIEQPEKYKEQLEKHKEYNQQRAILKKENMNIDLYVRIQKIPIDSIYQYIVSNNIQKHFLSNIDKYI